MIILSQAFKLIKIKDDECIKIMFSNGKEQIYTAKEIKNKLDMKSITVNHIEPWFSFYGDWNGWKMEVKDNDNS